MTLRVDGISLVLAAIALTLGTLVVLYSNRYIAHEENEDKYYAMLVALVGVMIGLGCATDLFNLWVWFEAMAISSYLLVAFYRDQPASLEAGVKYLVQSAVGSVLVLLGIALVLAMTGTVNLLEIRAAAGRVDALPLLAAGALFVIGFGVKAALVPMHTWLPDAHSQAPSGISAMLSGVVIEAGLVALLRAVASLSGVTLSWGVLLMAFGALNMLAGNLLALRQKQVKRMLAFSSLSHMGYMLVGLGIAVYMGQSAAASGSFFHVINHGLMKGLAFLAAGAMLYVLFIKNNDHTSPLTISDLGGAAQALSDRGLHVEHRGAGSGRTAAVCGLHVQVADFRGGLRDAQYRDRSAGDLRGVEQCALAGVLRAGRECGVPAGTIGSRDPRRRSCRSRWAFRWWCWRLRSW